MDKNLIKPHLVIILAVAAMWGITEFAFGLGLKKCAVNYAGAILTGLAFFWLSFAWGITRKAFPIIFIVMIVTTFKMLDALLLPVAWNHGSILNPAYAFYTQMVGFMIVISIFRRRLPGSPIAHSMMGAASAVIAVALFPLVKYITGTPACLYATTNIPLVIFTSPVALILSMITVPLGFYTAERFSLRIDTRDAKPGGSAISWIWSPALLMGCMLIITLVRIL